MFPIEFLKSVPNTPGVYRMLDHQSRILYVGKAKDLKKRLTSYTRFSGTDHNKTTVMLARVERVDTLLTNTEKEALILEASLIKKHKPRYNIILRDDKNYPFIKVTVQEEWPRVFMARRKRKDGARYFGPFASSSAMWGTLRLLANMFSLRRCKGSAVKKRTRPCLNMQMGKCPGPCVELADPVTYQGQVQKVLMVLEGKNKSLLNSLKDEMKSAAAALDFEHAAELRDQIRALSQTLEKQIIASAYLRNLDVFGFFRKNTSIGISILFIRDGLISGNRNFFLQDTLETDKIALSQVLNQFYTHDLTPSKEVVLPFAISDSEPLAEHFSELNGSQVHLKVPQRGDRLKLIGMANTNAAHLFDEKEKEERSWQGLSASMEKLLHLQNSPDRIECLDISNTSGKQAVGSLICYVKGNPSPSHYRHYRIQTVPGPDDYAMMNEVLQRRFAKGVAEDNLPDLFVVDGGKGQLNIAMRAADAFGIRDELDWIGIAKEKEDEGEKLYKPGRKNPIVLQSHNPVLLYLMRIRDESHRFGITFHRKLRNKAAMASTLDLIPGIGNKKKKQLLQKLGSVKRIQEASVDELCTVQGIGQELAAIIHAHFSKAGEQ